MKKVAFVVLVTSFFVSCICPYRNFTTLEFNKIWIENVKNPGYKFKEFQVSSTFPMSKLKRAKATLMFQDLLNGQFLLESYKLKFNGTILTLQDTTDRQKIEDISGRNLLYVVHFEFRNMEFYSNPQPVPYTQMSVTQLSSSTSSEVPPPIIPEKPSPGFSNSPLSPISELSLQEDIHAIVYQLRRRESFIPAGSGYTIYKMHTNSTEDENLLTYVKGSFCKTESGQSTNAVVNNISTFLRQGYLVGMINFSLIIVCSADLSEISSQRTDKPMFNREKVYSWDSVRQTLSDAEYYTRLDTQYSLSELPKLRAVELKNITQKYLEPNFPGIQNKIFALYEAPKDGDLVENRQIDIFVVVPRM